MGAICHATLFALIFQDYIYYIHIFLDSIPEICLGEAGGILFLNFVLLVLEEK